MSNNIQKLQHDYLDWLESESIFIIREVVAQCANPAMLFSGGKDSVVMFHLARKAFALRRQPTALPFPLVHIDTGHNYQEVIQFRDELIARTGDRLVVGMVQASINKGSVKLRQPTDSRNAAQAVTLLETIADHQFDALMGGARRDEEKARAKERIFSFRDEFGQWDPKTQRPELWQLYNARITAGEHMRVFPISNWTELDIWQYILREDIPIVPLYLAAERPVIERDGLILMVDDERMRLYPDDTITNRRVRFRTLGCYPLTGATESEAENLRQVIQEMLLTTSSERQGRAVDHDETASMERKKQAGYF